MRETICGRANVSFHDTVLPCSAHLRKLHRPRVSQGASAFNQLRAFLIERTDQHLADCGRFSNQPIKVSYLFMRELPPTFRLWPSRGAVEQYAHVSDAESDPLCKPDDRQTFQGEFVIAPTPVHLQCLRQQSDRFVVPDRGGSHPAPLCHFANTQIGHDKILLT